MVAYQVLLIDSTELKTQYKNFYIVIKLEKSFYSNGCEFIFDYEISHPAPTTSP